MRTLVVVRSLKLGGMERVAVNLADAFSEEGCDSHLVYLRKTKNGLMPDNPNVKMHFLPLRRILRLTVVGFVIDVLARLLMNVIIRRSYFVWVGWLGGLVFYCWLFFFERRYGRVDRIVFRGMGSFEDLWGFKDNRAKFVLENMLPDKESSIKEFFFYRCLLQGKNIVAVSDGVLASLHKLSTTLGLSPASTKKIVNPCPIAYIRELMLKNDQDVPDEKFILNVARLVPQKDHDLLLRAYARAGISEKLVILGEGRLKKDLEKKADQLGIRNKVVFLGRKLNPYPFMASASLLVLSSRVEGMGIVLFEALACGTPVVSVDCRGGIREILKGELESSIVARDENALAHKIKKSVKDAKPVIREKWLDDFRPETVARQFLE